MNRLQYLGLSFMIFYVLLFTAIETTAVTKPLYEYEYQKYQVYDIAFVKNHDVRKVTEDIIFYLSDLNQSMNRRELFEPREHRHMIDVKRLFTIGKFFRTAFLPLIIILISRLLSEKNFLWKLCKAYLGFIAALSIVAVIGSMNFQGAFVKFHEIFFSNEYWLLYPEESIIINLMPEGFFMDMGKYIIALFLLLNILNAIALKLCHYKHRMTIRHQKLYRKEIT